MKMQQQNQTNKPVDVHYHDYCHENRLFWLNGLAHLARFLFFFSIKRGAKTKSKPFDNFGALTHSLKSIKWGNVLHAVVWITMTPQSSCNGILFFFFGFILHLSLSDTVCWLWNSVNSIFHGVRFSFMRLFSVWLFVFLYLHECWARMCCIVDVSPEHSSNHTKCVHCAFKCVWKSLPWRWMTNRCSDSYALWIFLLLYEK